MTSSHLGNTATMRAAPGCGARTLQDTPYCAPAVRGGRRCRMQGGTGSSASAGNRNAWKHGGHSWTEAMRRRRLRRMIRKMESLLIGLVPGVFCSGVARPLAPPVVRMPASGATVHGVVSPNITTAEQQQECEAEAKSCGANSQSPYIKRVPRLGPQPSNSAHRRFVSNEGNERR